ncbi:MAG: helix-turn-helix domain-containing protein [Saprospiraceae bacterium]|nr:helix-turn-helix domain-containing protein [Saprospiraceae bacterium]
MNQIREQASTEFSRHSHPVSVETQASDEGVMPMDSYDTDKLIYIEGGTAYVQTEDKTWYLLARHYIWIPQGIRHGIQPTTAGATLRTLYFQAKSSDPDFFKQVGVYPVNDLLLEMIDYTKDWKGLILPEDENRFTFGMAIKAILPELSKNKLPFCLPMAKDSRLKKITAYLLENLSSPLHLSEIAQQFGVSERSLARLFQSDLRMSYIKYLRTLRIIHALALLSTTKMSVYEVAYQVGYNSFPTFSNMFYQIVGVRPKSYLQQKL